jgi:hypothetical protein
MFVTWLCVPGCARTQILPRMWIGVVVNSRFSRRAGSVLNRCMFFQWRCWAPPIGPWLAEGYILHSSQVIVGGYPGGASSQSPLSLRRTEAAGSLCICPFRLALLLTRATTFNIEQYGLTLVAGLQVWIRPSLYQYGTSSREERRKDIRSVALVIASLRAYLQGPSSDFCVKYPASSHLHCPLP